MGLSKLILTIAIVVIAGSLVTVYVPSAFDSLNNWIGEVYNASLFTIQPRAGEIICDLIIETNVSLTQEDFSLLGITLDDVNTLATPTEFTVPVNNPYTYEYARCTQQQGFVIANLLDNGIGKAPRAGVVNIEGIQTNGFLNPLGHDFTQQIRLTDAFDSTQKIDWVLAPNLSYTTSIPPSISQETPLSLDATFIIPNIPVRIYDIEIHLSGADLGINGMEIGEPFEGQICNAFSNFVNGRCVPLS